MMIEVTVSDIKENIDFAPLKGKKFLVNVNTINNIYPDNTVKDNMLNLIPKVKLEIYSGKFLCDLYVEEDYDYFTVFYGLKPLVIKKSFNLPCYGEES